MPISTNLFSEAVINCDITRQEAYRLIKAEGALLDEVFDAACRVRERRTGRIVGYSRKVFIPLTNLCRDRCAYCTFARTPGDGRARTLTPDQVLAIAQAGERAGCKEALFSLGERPELRYPAHRRWLQENGYSTTIDHLTAMCQLVLDRTSLIPHVNPGTMRPQEITKLKPVAASMGMMLESTSNRLLGPGQAHYGCPDKTPARRLATLNAAGEAQVPFTTGILIGIGESPEERVDTLFAILRIHQRYRHIQEVIVQNFRAKADTRFAAWPEPAAKDLARTAAVARLIFGAGINIQIPPNLSPGEWDVLLRAGINDWGGVSPVTLDFINPELAWPKIGALKRATEDAGLILRERLTVYPEYLRGSGALFAGAMHGRALEMCDETGLAKQEVAS